MVSALPAANSSVRSETRPSQSILQPTGALSDEARWAATLARDATYDGAFVFAVRSTGVYCRPTCPSRRPRRAQVSFYATSAQAEAAGYRACKRCHPATTAPTPPAALADIQRLCAYIDEHLDETLTLRELSDRAHISPFHLQRVFKQIVGVSPRQYIEALRLGRLKDALQAGDDVITAQYAAGFSSSSRVYERAADHLGMTPGAYRRGAQAQTIRYTLADSPLGRLLVARTERGVCAIRMGEDDGELLDGLAREFPAATLQRDDPGMAETVSAIANYLAGQQPALDLPLDVRATAFQRRVWEALQAIPYGETRSYRQIAEAIGQPGAVRAVGQACAANPIAPVIPCHRALRSDGGLGGYRWGLARKRKLLESEKMAE